MRRSLPLVLLGLPCLGLPLAAQVAPLKKAPPSLQRAFVQFDSAFRRQDAAAIAAWFLPSGAMGSAGHPPIIGPDSIAAQLRRFADYHLLDEYLRPDSAAWSKRSARVAGHYWQRVRLPAGDTVETHGTFVMRWARVPGDSWRLRSLITDP